MEYIEIRLGDVLPNPYRKIDQYHLQPERIKALEESISDTELLPNIVGRLNEDGEFEIAYGHHRLQAAINVLGRDHIQSFPLGDYPDYYMLQIMVRENSEHWGCTTEHNNLAVSEVRDFLDNLLDQYPTWAQGLKADEFGGKTEDWFVDEQHYNTAVSSGVGRPILMRFMGEGSLSYDDVKYSLSQVGPSSKQMAAAEAKAAAEAAKVEKAKAKLKEQQKRLKEANTKKQQAEAKHRAEVIEASLRRAEKERKQAEAKLAEAGTYDPKAGEQFNKPIHANTFRQLVTSEPFKEIMPKEQQEDFAKEIKRKLKGDRKEVTVKNIEQYGNSMKKKHLKAVTMSDVATRYRALLKRVHMEAAGCVTNIGALRKAMREDEIVSFTGVEADKLYEKLGQLYVSVANFYLLFGRDLPELSKARGTDGKARYTIDVRDRY